MSSSSSPLWGWGRFARYTAVVAVGYLGLQVAAVIAVGIIKALRIPDLDIDTWAATADQDGTVVTVIAFAAALVVPLIRFLIGRHEPRPWDFLGLRSRRARDIAAGIGAVIGFILVSAGIDVIAGPQTSEFMIHSYATAGSLPLFFIAIVVVAPVVEELLFRGYLFGALRACGLSMAATVAVVAIVFAAVHTQYDWYNFGLVAVLGILFTVARARFDSILPSIAMHSFANAAAFLEMSLFYAA